MFEDSTFKLKIIFTMLEYILMKHFMLLTTATLTKVPV